VSHSPEPVTSGTEAGQPRWTSDRLVNIQDIRKIFKLGRTAAYELTHRPEFPEPVVVSTRCYRWWASEVDAFAASLRSKRAPSSRRSQPRRTPTQHLPHPATPPRRITGKVRAARTRRNAP
jgi:predicted DNA-binding transcriptional regulator AlpA